MGIVPHAVFPGLQNTIQRCRPVSSNFILEFLRTANRRPTLLYTYNPDSNEVNVNYHAHKWHGFLFHCRSVEQTPSGVNSACSTPIYCLSTNLFLISLALANIVFIHVSFHLRPQGRRFPASPYKAKSHCIVTVAFLVFKCL